MSWWGYRRKAQVSVEMRRARAAEKIAQLREQGRQIQPVVLEGKAIAKTYLGKAWCRHLETLGDDEAALTTGRKYVRFGAVLDLSIRPGEIRAQVYGDAYARKLRIVLDPLACERRARMLQSCGGKMDALIARSSAKIPTSVMKRLTHSEAGLLPAPQEIALHCSCPEEEGLCPHAAAVLYGVGARLDTQPEALLLLRQLNPVELLTQTAGSVADTQASQTVLSPDADLSALFGIAIEKRGKKSIKPRTRMLKKPRWTPNMRRLGETAAGSCVASDL